jgi:hypothetical protein
MDIDIILHVSFLLSIYNHTEWLEKKLLEIRKEEKFDLWKNYVD